MRLFKEVYAVVDLYTQLVITSEFKKNVLEYGREYIRTHLR